MPEPTFFLAGAPKAGTTSLFRCLAQHPDIAVAAIKEPCFFAPEVPVDAATSAHRASWEAYAALFHNAGTRRAIGEGSVAYFSSHSAPASIHARLPHAKILLMLRDPADRLFAHYSAARTSGARHASFGEWLDAEQRAEDARQPRWGAIWAGYYGAHLARYRSIFAPAQIHIELYEHFAASPDDVIARCFSFLDVDPTVTVDHRTRHNETTAPRWPALSKAARAVLEPVLPASAYTRLRGLSRKPRRLTPDREDRARAIALYQNDIASLLQITTHDLTHWLVP